MKQRHERWRALRADVRSKTTGRVYQPCDVYKGGMHCGYCESLNGTTHLAYGPFIRILFCPFYLSSIVGAFLDHFSYVLIKSPYLYFPIYLQLVESSRKSGRVWRDRESMIC
ncbi:hypothetical protein M431DRAFT_290938 [Trichoderma harzianum CBS 226.95]|uniref:Uncharacterized protein n=1 Tax=Trichoderma harzianum CBS 226.95 TaxID=983964 RepID=A0A2T4APE0_TRIHA|nr:hypothetical protein M431DRAFT_290938 [Trichoderma harzianum CBS 226.95]PTB58929.1 hypothetical protein M431DRAFT_290938 [Trichoderma harzianum CBS 226.95]